LGLIDLGLIDRVKAARTQHTHRSQERIFIGDLTRSTRENERMTTPSATATTNRRTVQNPELMALHARHREACARLDALKGQIAAAKRDVMAASWAIDGYKIRSRAKHQLAGGK
jgi:hypothetical protein